MVKDGKPIKPKSLKNRGVLDHHFLEEIPREMLHVFKKTKKTGSSQSQLPRAELRPSAAGDLHGSNPGCLLASDSQVPGWR